jgi:hypothetical protein
MSSPHTESHLLPPRAQRVWGRSGGGRNGKWTTDLQLNVPPSPSLPTEREGEKNGWGLGCGGEADRAQRKKFAPKDSDEPICEVFDRPLASGRVNRFSKHVLRPGLQPMASFPASRRRQPPVQADVRYPPGYDTLPPTRRRWKRDAFPQLCRSTSPAIASGLSALPTTASVRGLSDFRIGSQHVRG